MSVYIENMLGKKEKVFEADNRMQAYSKIIEYCSQNNIPLNKIRVYTKCGNDVFDYGAKDRYFIIKK